MHQQKGSVKQKIYGFEATSDILSSRAGLALVSKYIDSLNVAQLLASILPFGKKNKKGTPLFSIIHQLICFFFDGTDFHMTRFDQLKKDSGYSGTIETKSKFMISSHTAKRFFYTFSKARCWLFRRMLHKLFLWRLHIEKPQSIKLGIDTMVLDNNDAQKREGVEPTYKNRKGFQPLQLFWGRYLIDAIFRNGSAHSNHGDHVFRMVKTIVKLIRSDYETDIPIILIADTGFYDQKLFQLCETLGIGFIVGGKIYESIKTKVQEMPDEEFSEFEKGKKSWFFCEFEDQRGAWQKSWRAIYAKPVPKKGDQVLLDFARPETIMYTNIGQENEITKALEKLHGVEILSAEVIIHTYHMRAKDELVNRGLKDFGTEHLPFLSFGSNAAFYYFMTISFFLFESFKFDVDHKLIPKTLYASSFRRRVIDIAGRIVSHSKRIVIKVAKSIYTEFDFSELWRKSGTIGYRYPLLL